MLKTASKEIGGRNVRTVQFPVFKALKLFKSLGGVVGPATSAIGEGMNEIATIGAVVGSALQAIDNPEALVRQILEGTSIEIDGRLLELSDKANIESAFSGRMLELFEVVAFAINVNFEDFFAGVRGLFARTSSTPAAAASA